MKELHNTYYFIKGEKILDLKPFYSKTVHCASNKLFQWLYKEYKMDIIEFKMVRASDEKIFQFVGQKIHLDKPKTLIINNKTFIVNYMIRVRKSKKIVIEIIKPTLIYISKCHEIKNTQ